MRTSQGFLRILWALGIGGGLGLGARLGVSGFRASGAVKIGV